MANNVIVVNSKSSPSNRKLLIVSIESRVIDRWCSYFIIDALSDIQIFFVICCHLIIFSVLIRVMYNDINFITSIYIQLR